MAPPELPWQDLDAPYDGSALSSIEPISSPTSFASGFVVQAAPGFGPDSPGSSGRPWQADEVAEMARIASTQTWTLAASGSSFRLPPPRPLRPERALQEPVAAVNCGVERPKARTSQTSNLVKVFSGGKEWQSNLVPCPATQAKQSAVSAGEPQALLADLTLPACPLGELAPACLVHGATAKMRFPFIHADPVPPPRIARRCPPVFLWAPAHRESESECDTDSLPVPESVDIERAKSLAEGCEDGQGFPEAAPATDNPDPDVIKAVEPENCELVEAARPPSVSLAPARRLRGIRLCGQESYTEATAPGSQERVSWTQRDRPLLRNAEPARSDCSVMPSGPSADVEVEQQLDLWSVFFEDAAKPQRTSTIKTALPATATWRAGKVAAMEEQGLCTVEGESMQSPMCMDGPEPALVQPASLEETLPACSAKHIDENSDSDSEYWTSSQRFELETAGQGLRSVQWPGHRHSVWPVSPVSPASVAHTLSPGKRVWGLRSPAATSGRSKRVTLSLDASGASWLGEPKSQKALN